MSAAQFTFQALGTHWQIDIESLPPHQEGGFLLNEIKNRLEAFETLYSRFRPDSLVSRLAAVGGTVTLPPDAFPLLKLYEKIYTLTDGAVTPLIGQVLVDAGYDAAYSLTPKEMRRPPRWEDILTVSPAELTLKQPAQLDFGALGKGYAIDIIAELIAAHGLRSFCVEAGGDMAYRSEKPDDILRVGLENPEDTTQVIGVANLITDLSICGSAGNRRSWGRFNHIINPHTLESPRHILAAWAIAKTTLLADALTSCLFFTPAEKLKTEFDFHYAIMYADHSVEQSSGFPGEFFTA